MRTRSSGSGRWVEAIVASTGASSDAPAASASTDTASITSARSGIRKAKRRR